jgi:hypothetical protein
MLPPLSVYQRAVEYNGERAVQVVKPIKNESAWLLANQADSEGDRMKKLSYLTPPQ